MIRIEICPANGCSGGYYKAVGHASKGKELICNAVTVLEDCLMANLENVWNLRMRHIRANGAYTVRWNKTDRRGQGLQRANQAAGFVYNGLRALARAYPEEVKVEWKRPGEIGTSNACPYRDGKEKER